MIYKQSEELLFKSTIKFMALVLCVNTTMIKGQSAILGDQHEMEVTDHYDQRAWH